MAAPTASMWRTRASFLTNSRTRARASSLVTPGLAAREDSIDRWKVVGSCGRCALVARQQHFERGHEGGRVLPQRPDLSGARAVGRAIGGDANGVDAHPPPQRPGAR